MQLLDLNHLYFALVFGFGFGVCASSIMEPHTFKKKNLYKYETTISAVS